MAQSINLIPRQEVAIQTETKLISLSTIISYVVLGVVSLVSIIFLVISINTKNQLASLDANIESIRASIKAQSPIEIVARNLDKKYEVLMGIFNERNYYSKLLSELYVRKPEGVEILDFSIHEDNTIDISGKADVYLQVADFTNRLVNENFTDGNPALRKLFTEVTLNSVNLESSGAGFSIKIKFDPSRLKETL